MKLLIEERSVKVPESGCWIWERSSMASGYGDFRLGKKHHLAHRASYLAFNGPIPIGMHVMHSCDVRPCVNPQHLSVGTNLDNIQDSMKKGRRKGITRNRPSGMKYNFSDAAKEAWIEKKRKIKANQRIEIKDAYATGFIKRSALARLYKCSTSLIDNIVGGAS